MTTKLLNERGKHLTEVMNAYGVGASYLKDALRNVSDKRDDGDIDMGAAYHLLDKKCRQIVAVLERACQEQIDRMNKENIWERPEGVELAKGHQAEARLIAAAPALLEALEGLVANAPAPRGIRKDFHYILYREAAITAIAASR